MLNVSILALSLGLASNTIQLPPSVLHQNEIHQSVLPWRYTLQNMLEERRKELEYIEYMQKNFVSIHGEYVYEGEIDDEFKPLEPLQLNTNDISIPSNATAEEINFILEDTGMEGIGESIVECESEYGVNSFVLCSIIAQETSWGRSRRAVEDNNLAGLGVYEASSVGFKFDSKHDSIVYLAKLIGVNYISPGGKFYVGGKSIKLVSATYTPPCQEEWSRNVTSISNSLYKKALAYREGNGQNE